MRVTLVVGNGRSTESASRPTRPRTEDEAVATGEDALLTWRRSDKPVMLLDTKDDYRGRERIGELMLATVRAGWSLTLVTEDFIEHPTPFDCRTHIAVPMANLYPVESVFAMIERLLQADPYRRFVLQSGDAYWTSEFVQRGHALVKVVATQPPRERARP